MDDRILDIQGLCARDSVEDLLVDVSLHVATGGRTAIVGESGCGKTMTLRSLLHTLPPDVEVCAGRIRFMGEDALALKGEALREKLYMRIGHVGQNTSENLHPLLKVSRQLTDFSPLGRKEALDKATALLESLSIKDPGRVLSSYPGELSGGMRQRVNMAIALMKDAPLLIADEPTSALDAHVRRQVEDLYHALCQREGLSLLLISHDLSFVRRIADRVYVMYAGRVVEEGSVGEVFDEAAHPYTKALASLSGRRSLDRTRDLDEIGGSVPDKGRGDPSCAFASRCPYAAGDCHNALSYRHLGGSHYVRCCHELA